MYGIVVSYPHGEPAPENTPSLNLIDDGPDFEVDLNGYPGKIMVCVTLTDVVNNKSYGCSPLAIRSTGSCAMGLCAPSFTDLCWTLNYNPIAPHNDIVIVIRPDNDGSEKIPLASW